MKKVDSRRNAIFVIASRSHLSVIASKRGSACVAIHKLKSTIKPFRRDLGAACLTAKFMDRHAAIAARDDRKMPSLRDTALAVAWQSISTPKVDSSMDRHAAIAARDDRKRSVK